MYNLQLLLLAYYESGSYSQKDGVSLFRMWVKFT